uniref:Uncharacterized protein n=1 Tax=Pyxicephalus adspersus TaxID=30357 RepID=A0AAV3APZ1_PYXAD|nr:TPA: hypothetical protein GDO54_009028 [Pyxicephalus adspersus]
MNIREKLFLWASMTGCLNKPSPHNPVRFHHIQVCIMSVALLNMFMHIFVFYMPVPSTFIMHMGGDVPFFAFRFACRNAQNATSSIQKCCKLWP